MSEIMPSKILCVGLACLDIVMVCKDYPLEDSDQRALSQRWNRGGNASNNCTVLKALDMDAEFLGTLSDDWGGRFMLENFHQQGIQVDNSVIFPECECPTACVIINAKNGSRTILHVNRNLPELPVDAFMKLDLSQYKWVHFEGRNVDNIIQMLQHIDQWNASSSIKIKTSVELEKNRPELGKLLDKADVIFVSKEFGSMLKCNNSREVVDKLGSQVKSGAILICPWGETGACARNADGSVVSSPAFPPEVLVDTLAAGDTFIATCIAALSLGWPVADSITVGCRVAGAKCGIEGFNSSVLQNALKSHQI